MNPEPLPHILVVDPDTQFLDAIRADPRASMTPVAVVNNRDDAHLAIADQARAFSAIFFNPRISSPHGLGIVLTAQRHRPATPIYLIHEGANPPLDRFELANLPIQKALKKPLAYADMLKLIAPIACVFDPKEALAEAARNPDALDAPVEAADPAFVPIRAEDFLSGTKSFFDVYVRLATGRYVKILHAGDTFTPDRVIEYVKKGVKNFHLRREAQEHYLGYCEKLTEALLKNDRIPIEAKTSQTLNHGEETLSFLRATGVTDLKLRYAISFVKNTQTLVKQLHLDRDDLVRAYMDKVADYNHVVGTTMVASLLLTPLEFESDKSVQIVGIATLLHDIGLYRVLPDHGDEDEDKMTAEQKALYHMHPTIGAHILSNFKTVDPAVVQAVAQHHERRNRKGFPKSTGATQLSRVAEIVGISDEFVRLIQQRAKDPGVDPFHEMQSKYFEGFSLPIQTVFRSVFMKDPEAGEKKNSDDPFARARPRPRPRHS